MRKPAAFVGILAGVAAVAIALYMSAQDAQLGYPWGVSVGFISDSEYLLKALSAAGLMLGMGVVMIAGGLLTLKNVAVGGVMVVAAAVVGLVFTYTHEWHRVDLLYYWAVPLLLCWVAGILAGYALQRETEAYG
jgi:hypothetical protein